ncbi:hypothetical protein BASA50_005911 [Batrachochytrium salamandrivorans]|uniref:Uncharacterized protein n=1 Tax=Batrachochytrium salamandrivorans TaxID=1357716 RepID=A0ABQ8FBZ7_9FUNG|nr:hypothetical protein BASA50_005911 [Batrachochytrium salamandrivorans]
MQFFHLFSFVVVASYAAALPQPAGLSEKYSNNADATLASGLEARSYQPGLNSQKDSATLVSLKRRDDSDESVGDNSGGSVGDNSGRSVGDNSGGSVGAEDNSGGSVGDNSGGSVGAEDNSEGSTGDNSEESVGAEDNSEESVGDNSGGSVGDNSEESTGDNSEESVGDNSGGSVGAEDNSEGSTGDNSEESVGAEDNSEESVGDNSGGSVGDNSEESTGDNSEESVGDNSEESTGDNSEESVGDNSGGSVGDNSEESTGDNSEESVGDNSGGSVGAEDNSEGSTGDNSEGSTGDNSGGSVGDNSGGSVGDNSEESVGDNSGGSVGDNSEESTEDNSEESVGDNSGGSSGKDSVQANDALRAKAELEFKDLASTIDKIRGGDYTFLGDVEKAKQKIDGPLGDMVAEYLGKATHLNDVLERWEENSEPSILGFIRSGLGEDEYSEIEPDLTEELNEWNHNARGGSDAILHHITRIANNSGSAISNFRKIHKSFGRAVRNHINRLWKLKELLEEFGSGKTLEVQLADIAGVVNDFYKEQHRLSIKIKKGLRAASCANRNARVKKENRRVCKQP